MSTKCESETFKDLGLLSYKSEIKNITIPLKEIPQDVSVHPELIIFRDDDQLHIYDRKCDHNGGKLCLRDNIIKCPLHDWEFNPKLGGYTNVQISKKKLSYKIIGENLSVNFTKSSPKLPNTEKKLKIKITFLAHACLLVETEDVSFITDPWIVGFAFAGGWWPNKLPPENWKEIVNSVDFIYISHNHPDHLNLFTLEYVRKDMEFIVPKFPSQSVSKILRSNGFENILESEFQNYYQYKNTDLFLTIFKSGDFRDDSGLYFTYGNFSFLSTVDSNDLNFQKFPKDITLFASAFASGSSGYPLCFDTVTEEEKDRILQRNRNATKAMVRLNLKKCNGKFYLPYAGFFAEKAKRDFAILNRNSKNKITDYQDTQKNFILLNIEDFDSYSFIGSNLQEQQAIRRDEKYQDDPEDTISKVFGQYSFDKIFLKRYFENCNFQKDLVLYLSLTNDDFSERKNSMIVDFRESRTQVKFLKFDWENIKEGMNESTTLPSFNLLHIKVRQDSFLWAINNHMPWEDLSIGFQCRIDRVPDVYNVDFWDHFTNVYL